MYFIDGVAVGSIHHDQLDEVVEEEEVEEHAAPAKRTKRAATVTSEDVST
jgi:hypothetical protein